MKKAIRATIGALILSAAVLSAAISHQQTTQQVGSGGDPVPQCPPGLCLTK